LDAHDVHKATVKYDILQKVQNLVKSNYVDQRPKHHLHSARNPEIEPNTTTSIFFITEHANIANMETETIQEIHRHRHIIVCHAPDRQLRWSLDTLSLVGGLYQSRDIQGVCNL
jgi:hypothetical protein